MTRSNIQVGLIALGILLLLFSCKKEEDNFKIRGTVRGASGELITGASVKVQKQSVSSGIYTSNYTTAVSGTSDNSGRYDLTFQRENFSSLRLNAEAPNYIISNTVLDLDRFSPGEYVDQDIKLYKEAFVKVNIQNLAPAAASDHLNFTFTNALFDCVCCSNGWKYFSGASIDTSFTCRVYGDTWLRYSRYIQTAALDTTINDSIFCPAIENTQINIEY